ncbi:MAG: hypothetical protein JOS17DRAFT_729904 [Linnemannia elongata]|nr:MAG: hypothetical protein JOS17DRAFT_729904 [Linnemannia elongata]
MRILSLRDLGSLETLRAPWWPAARIYTIRRQLEKWSFVVEQALATAHDEGADIDQSQSAGLTPMDALQPTPTPSPRCHWINRFLSGEDTSTISTWRPAAAHSRPMPEAPEVETQPQIPEATTAPTPVFPLASLTKFNLRYGGEMSSHDHHCLGISAMILSGRSSADSLHAGTPPPQAITDPRTSISSESNPPSLTATHSPWNGMFRYCHHCGSQYLQISTTASNPLHGACFCRRSTPMPS